MPDNPSTDPQLDEACRQVGKFLYHFAMLEEVLDGIIQKALKLHGTQGRILGATIPLTRKVDTARSVIDTQREKNPAWKKAASDDIGAITRVNDARRMVAHARFSPIGDRSVQFRYATVGKVLDPKDPIWDDQKFCECFDEMDKIRERLERIKRELVPLEHLVEAINFSTGSPTLEAGAVTTGPPGA